MILLRRFVQLKQVRILVVFELTELDCASELYEFQKSHPENFFRNYTKICVYFDTNVILLLMKATVKAVIPNKISKYFAYFGCQRFATKTAFLVCFTPVPFTNSSFNRKHLTWCSNSPREPHLNGKQSFVMHLASQSLTKFKSMGRKWIAYSKIIMMKSLKETRPTTSFMQTLSNNSRNW